MNNPLIAALVVAVALMGGFYGGFRYESTKVVAATAATTPTPATAGRGAGNFAGGGAGGGFAGAGGGGAVGGRGSAGTVSNVTATGFTLTSANGTVTQVTLGSSATVRKTVTGSLSDLAAGASVAVTGTRDTAGNLVATGVTILPAAAPTGG